MKRFIEIMVDNEKMKKFNTHHVMITVCALTPGSGLSKYIVSLATILKQQGYMVTIMTTHGKDVEYESHVISACGDIGYISFGHCSRLKRYVKVWNYLRNVHPDYIINNFNAVVQYILPLLPRSIKLVHVLHSTTSEFYRIACINKRFVRGWIVPTSAMENEFNLFTGNKYAHKVRVLPHGVELPSASELKPISKVKELIFIGVLYEHKGVCILPEIIHRLKYLGESFHFTIIGDGILHEDLEKQLQYELREGYVTMTGVIPSAEVYKYLQKADIFVYPTHIDSFGLVIAEAMINSTVPLVTHLPGITDNIVDNERNGYLLGLDDVSGFVDRIRILMHNDALLLQLKEAAYKCAIGHFSLDVMRNNYHHYLEEL